MRVATHPSTAAPPHGQRMNALKHGHYAQSVLLPGEDAMEFLRRRRALFHLYRPQTVDEADLVHALAEHGWIKRRFAPAQAMFDAPWVAPERDAGARVCEPTAHERQHSGLDVSVRWKRVENMWHRSRAKLMELQKLRSQGLIPGAVKLPEDCYMETDGTVYGPVTQHTIMPVVEPELVEAADSASGSADTADGKMAEQKERVAVGSAAARIGSIERAPVVPWLAHPGTGIDPNPGALHDFQWNATPQRPYTGVSSC
ncbi:MAG TPA: hypothetical protein VF678_07695 [bacterium]